uniref:Lymphocyte antigen 6E-like n=1 Tax=Geotrypetes seraphini TaxID=260995 RepID=A0A6P8QTZ7_GEOSA|nr:lymphocyte antigen 6E-like [Geotrypetes seraphini]
MKPFLACLLAAALCVQTVRSLTCFVCDNKPTNWKCLSPKKCGAFSSFCMTSTTSGGTGSYKTFSISKSCVPICIPVNLNAGVAGTSVTCCKKDLCNYSSATSVKISSLALVVSASFLVLLSWTGL